MNHLLDRAEITDDKAMHEIAVEEKIWEIFILNTDYVPNTISISSANLFDY